ncbi:hypothetical protein K439DRAFT_1623074 [Ramaria rubella]|nr:hypothetical protein K439DRAFT_1623074 [Ramaria rubella]
MPLSSGNAFDALKRKLTHKLVVIMVNMKAPRAPDKIQPPWAANDTSPWTSQIKMPAGFNTTADDTTAKGRTDDQLEELVVRLEEKYPEGLCTVHPDKHCFHQGAQNLHFELTRPHLLVWASSIVRTHNVCGTRSDMDSFVHTGNQEDLI